MALDQPWMPTGSASPRRWRGSASTARSAWSGTWATTPPQAPYAWSALSAACHYRTGELPPSPAEMRTRLDELRTLVQEDYESTVKVAFRLTAGPLRELADLASREGNRHIPHCAVPFAREVTPASVDALQRDSVLLRERCLLFVACTREREALAVTWSGSASSFVP